VEELPRAVAVAVAAATAALAERQDHRDHQEPRDDQETREPPEAQETQADLLTRCVSSQRVHRASHARKDHPVLQVQLERQEMPDQTDTQATQEAHHNLVHQDRPARQDSQETPGNLEDPDSPEPQRSRSQPTQDPLDHQEMPDHQADQDSQEDQASQEAQALPDPKDHLAHQDHQETTDSPASPVSLVSQEAQERRASARSTAPSTVVSSSRMEQDGVKKSNLQVFQSSLPFPAITLVLFPLFCADFLRYYKE